MKTLLIILFAIVIGRFSYGQQLPPYSLPQENWMLENPGSYSTQYLLGAKNHIVAVSGRYQWTELGDPPATIAVQYQSVLEDLNIAVGGLVIKDKTGAIGNTGVYGNFSYAINLSKGRNKKTQLFSVGLNFGIQQYTVDLSQIDFAEPDYLNLPLENLQQLYPDFSFGMFYYLDNTFFAGVSVPQTFQWNTSTSDEEGISFERVRHVMLSAGTYIPLTKSRGKSSSFFIPSAWIRYVKNAPVSINYNLRFSYGKHFFIGGGGNTSQVYRAETGFSLPFALVNEGSLNIGFAYEFNANSFSRELGNTFEVNISHSWGNSDKVECPSWF